MKIIFNNYCRNSISISRMFLCFLSVLLILSSCEDDKLSFQEEKRKVAMMAELRKDTSLTILVEALDRTKIAPLLDTYGPYTLFAPDNNAFRRYFKNSGKKGLDNYTEAELKTLMIYHIIPARIKSTEFIQGPQDKTTGNKDFITLDISKGYKSNTIANGKALLYETDIEYSNGFVHKMDGVLDPPTLTIGQFLLQNKDKYSIMIGGLQRAGLMDTLVNLDNEKNQRIRLTLFAETNDVLQASGITSYDNMPLEDVKKDLRYHIIVGGDPSKNYTKLTTAVPHLGWRERYDSLRTTLNGNDWIYFNLDSKHLINETVDFAASDVIMRNGMLHNVNAHLTFKPDVKRTPIWHVFANSQNYGYSMPGYSDGALAPAVGSGNWRITADNPDVPRASEKSITRNNIKILFAQPDAINDSIVTIVRNVKAGKYSFRVAFKNQTGGPRGTAQMMYREDKIGIPTQMQEASAVGTNGTPTYGNKIVGSYTFETSGDKRIKFVFTIAGQGIALESMVLTPEYN